MTPQTQISFPSEGLSITLTAETAKIIFDGLTELPYKISFPVIAELQQRLYAASREIEKAHIDPKKSSEPKINDVQS